MSSNKQLFILSCLYPQQILTKSSWFIFYGKVFSSYAFEAFPDRVWHRLIFGLLYCTLIILFAFTKNLFLEQIDTCKKMIIRDARNEKTRQTDSMPLSR